MSKKDQAPTANVTDMDLCEFLKPLSPFAPVFGGETIVPGLLFAMDAFAKADILFKKRRKAILLKSGSARDLEKLARGNNALGIRRMEQALSEFQKAGSALRNWNKGLDRNKRRIWPQIVKREILPEVQTRLLNSSLTVGELKLWLTPKNSLMNPQTWDIKTLERQFLSLPKTLGPYLQNRKQLQLMSSGQLNTIPLVPIPTTHQIVVILVLVLMKVALLACSMWLFIVCTILSLIWDFVQGWVYQEILESTRDGEVTG